MGVTAAATPADHGVDVALNLLKDLLNASIATNGMMANQIQIWMRLKRW